MINLYTSDFVTYLIDSNKVWTDEYVARENVTNYGLMNNIIKIENGNDGDLIHTLQYVLLSQNDKRFRINLYYDDKFDRKRIVSSLSWEKFEVQFSSKLREQTQTFMDSMIKLNSLEWVLFNAMCVRILDLFISLSDASDVLDALTTYMDTDEYKHFSVRDYCFDDKYDELCYVMSLLSHRDKVNIVTKYLNGGYEKSFELIYNLFEASNELYNSVMGEIRSLMDQFIDSFTAQLCNYSTTMSTGYILVEQRDSNSEMEEYY